MRDLIAEIAHGSLLVTLRSYTHDPVTPFARWFNEGWLTVSAERLALASGLSLSRVSRRQGDRGLTKRQADIQARMAALLDGAPVILANEDGAAIELPVALGTKPGSHWSMNDMIGILMRIANGDKLADAVASFHWPSHFGERLDKALTCLRTDYGIVLTSGNDGLPGMVSIPAPRWLSEHGGIADLTDQSDAPSALAEMADCWLGVVQQGIVEGIPAPKSKWNEWTNALPALCKFPWEERAYGRTLLLRYPAAAQERGLSRWPMLRWIVLAAWIHRSVQSDAVN